jgi:hypothetical protein
MKKLEQILLRIPSEMLEFIDKFSQEDKMNRTAYIRKVLMLDISERILSCDRGVYQNRITFNEAELKNNENENEQDERKNI